MSVTRLVTPDDAPVLAKLLHANRDFLAPWMPLRAYAYYTVDGQRDSIRDALGQYEQGTTVPRVILDGSGRVVGRIALNSVIRGFYQSCSLSYWLSEAHTGRGLATAAVREMVRVAFDDLGLHRVQAETLPDNVRSQRVLERNDFVRYGMAPDYIKIAGRWQDHVLYQRVDSAETR